jgi:hypothetical protein
VRLQELNLKSSTNKLEIDIIDMLVQKGSFAIVVSGGKAKVTKLPDHGETKIITSQGQIRRVIFDEGENF